MPATSRHSVRRRLGVAAAAAVAIGSAVMVGGAAGPAAAAPHAAPQAFKVTSYDLSGRVSKVTSSTHKRVTYFFAVSANSSGKSYAASAGLSMKNEFHDWSIPLKASAVKISATKGSGTVNTHSLMKSFGRFTLKVSSAGKAKKQCPSSAGYTSNRPVKITGTPTFNSNSGKHGWGTVDRKRVTLRGNLSVTFGSPTGLCGTPTTFCSPVGIAVSGFANPIELSAENVGHGASAVTAFRSVRLKSPHNASREDEVSGSAKALRLTKSGSKASVTLKGSSKTVTGSATVSSTESPFTNTCKNTKSTTYFGAWKNSSKKLTLHARIDGNLSLKNNNDAQIQVVTKK